MPLSSLPAELLLQILASAATHSLSSLFALASASRRLYTLFRADQATLLYRALVSDLGPVLADALALLHIQALDGPAQEWIAQLEEVLSVYEGYLAGGGPRNRLTAEEVTPLARWYGAVKFVAGVYTTCALGVFEKEVRPDLISSAEGVLDTAGGEAGANIGEVVTAPLSRPERLRILRAFYRLQIVQLVWSRPGCRMLQGTPDAKRVNSRLFGLWELWEVQQFFCAGAFYQRFRVELSDAWLGQYSRDPRIVTLTNRTRCCFSRFRDLVLEVRAVDQNAWDTTMRRESSFPSGPDVAGTEEESWAFWFRNILSAYSPFLGVPERHRFPVSLHFAGDGVNAMPLAWVDAYGGYYGYNFWELISGISHGGKPTQAISSRLGLVMLDAPRVGLENDVLPVTLRDRLRALRARESINSLVHFQALIVIQTHVRG